MLHDNGSSRQWYTLLSPREDAKAINWPAITYESQPSARNIRWFFTRLGAIITNTTFHGLSIWKCFLFTSTFSKWDRPAEWLYTYDEQTVTCTASARMNKFLLQQQVDHRPPVNSHWGEVIGESFPPKRWFTTQKPPSLGSWTEHLYKKLGRWLSGAALYYYTVTWTDHHKMTTYRLGVTLKGHSLSVGGCDVWTHLSGRYSGLPADAEELEAAQDRSNLIWKARRERDAPEGRRFRMLMVKGLCCWFRYKHWIT